MANIEFRGLCQQFLVSESVSIINCVRRSVCNKYVQQKVEQNKMKKNVVLFFSPITRSWVLSPNICPAGYPAHY